jgi:predicted RND superfamily exporter protein
VAPLVTAIVRGAHRRRTAVLCAVLALVLMSVEGIRRLSFDSDVLSLLPNDGRVIVAFKTFVARFGSLDQLYVVFTAPEGHAISEYRDDLDTWIEALRSAPEIERVDAGVIDRTRNFGWLADRQLLLLRGTSLDEALRRFTPEGMPAAIAERRELLSVPSMEVAALIQQDPLGLLDLLRGTLGSAQAGLNVGGGSEGYITPDRRARLVMARPRLPPYDATFSRALDARLNTLRASLGDRSRPLDPPADGEPLPPMQVEFAGGHRIAVETEAVVKRESIFNSAGSLALILPLLFVAFRSLWLVAIGSLPSALSLVLVLGGLGFAGARLSAAATGAAAMLFGLGVDGVVLLYVAHQLAIARGADANTTAPIEGPSTSMLLGMFTTAATFYGLAFVDFPSLRQLGLLIGHSMVICGLLTLVMVPALLPRRRPRRPRPALVMPRLAAWIVRRRRLILVGAAILTVGLGAAATGVDIDPTLDRLRSTTAAARLEERIGPAFGLPGDVYVVLAKGPDLQQQLEANERLTGRLSEAFPGLAVEPPSRLVPSLAAQARAMARVMAAGLSLSGVKASLEEARVASGFTPDAFAPFLDRLPTLINPAQRLSYDDYISHDLGDLVSRFIVRDGQEWLLATYVFPADATQVAAVQSVVEEVDPSQTLTGLPMVNADLARRFLPDFVKGLGIGTVVVVLLVAGTFRNGRLSFFALLPTAVGLVWTAGVLAIAGVTLDLFAIFAVVTFVGIGVDYGVHLVHRYREHADATRATAELAPVILVAAGITMFGYATLITSSYPPLRSIGVVSTVSVVALAAASVLLLPALLSRPGER